MSFFLVFFFFFFQAEDGIRDVAVTGVQTCALPISSNFTSLKKGYRLVGDVKFDEVKKVAGAITPVQIGRASCRERGEISVVAVTLKKKKINKRGEQIV